MANFGRANGGFHLITPLLNRSVRAPKQLVCVCVSGLVLSPALCHFKHGQNIILPAETTTCEIKLKKKIH